jgi:putative transposase
MLPISYARHQFPPAVIQHAVWVYSRFTLSYRDVEDLLAERGLDVSYETVRRWVLKFGPVEQRLRRCRPRPSGCWHLDEMVARIAGETMYLWRAVDHEGEVLDIVVRRGRDKADASRGGLTMRRHRLVLRHATRDSMKDQSGRRRTAGAGAKVNPHATARPVGP